MLKPFRSLGAGVVFWCMAVSASQISDVGGNSDFLLPLYFGGFALAWVPFTQQDDVGN